MLCFHGNLKENLPSPESDTMDSVSPTDVPNKAEAAAFLVQCLPSKYEAVGLFPALQTLGSGDKGL